MTITVTRLTGGDVARHLAQLADLRIAVFVAFPYLYDGEPAYEGVTTRK